MLNGKSILITGGTGSVGRTLVEAILQRYPNVDRVIVYSRDELKQSEMAQRFPPRQYPIHYCIGDVRDLSHLRRACTGVHCIMHTAALKQVPTAEENPLECIKTNVLGAQNVIDAARDSRVERVIALSTDKAVAPVSLYGATKLCADKLFVAANIATRSTHPMFSVVRFGNLMGSRGSLIPLLLSHRHRGILPITDRRMTRFHIDANQATDLLLYALQYLWGGEILVPRLPSYRVWDVAKAIAPDAKIDLIGIRPGEKLYEEMISVTEAPTTVALGSYYAILPAQPIWDLRQYISLQSATPVPTDFTYRSDTNIDWLSVAQLRTLIDTLIA